MKDQPGYYCAKAIESFSKVKAASKEYCRDHNVNQDVIEKVAFPMEILLGAAHKVHAPVWGYIFDRDQDRRPMWEYMYPPFDIMAIEFYAPLSPHTRPGRAVCPKRIAVVVSTHQLEKWAKQLGMASVPDAAEFDPNHSATLFSVYESPLLKGLWDVGPLSIAFDFSKEWTSSLQPYAMCKWVFGEGSMREQGYTDDPHSYQHLFEDMTDELFAMMDTFVVMNMPQPTDGPVVTRIPAPAKLNKKRAKSGKVLLDEYRVVECFCPWTRLPKSIQAYHGTSQRAESKRHTVKRHPRHLADGRWTWVKAHWRGNAERGTIERGFNVHSERDELL